MNLKRAFLFDIDDTLAPTSKFINKALEEVIIAMTREGLRVHTGHIPIAVDILKEIRKSNTEHSGNDLDLFCVVYGVLEKDRPKIVQAGVREYHKIRDVLLKPNPYAREVLDCLLAKGFVLGIVTNGDPEKQRDKIKYLEFQDYFQDYFYVSNDPKIRKPMPTMILQALKDIEADPSKSYYLGDRSTDVLAAHRAGVTAIRFLSGNHRGQSNVSRLLDERIAGEEILDGRHVQRLMELTPDKTIYSLCDVMDLEL